MGAGGDGGTGGGYYEGDPYLDPQAHLHDVRQGYGFKKDAPADPFDILVQLDGDIKAIAQQRLPGMIGNAVSAHPSVDQEALLLQARLQVEQELGEWHNATSQYKGDA
jgi:hypothetical protein